LICFGGGGGAAGTGASVVAMFLAMRWAGDGARGRRPVSQVEVAVLVYREDLEAEGGLSTAELEEKVAAERGRLMAKAEEALKKDAQKREAKAVR
jgi:cwf21 domain